jgi:hypothetical protein
MDLPTVILILRYLFTAAGGVLIAHGFATDNGLQQALGLIPALAPMVLGWLSQLQAHTAVKEAAVTGNPVLPTLTSAITPSPAAAANATAKR